MCCVCRMRFTPSLAFRHPPPEEGRRKPGLAFRHPPPGEGRCKPGLAFRHPPLEEGRRKPALGAWRFARRVPRLLPMGLNGLRCRADILGTNCKTLVKSTIIFIFYFFKGRGVVSASVRVTMFRTASRCQLLVQLCDQ